MQQNRKRTNSNRYQYHALEPRQLLAGDVSVAIVGSSLQIVGDDLANQVEVSINANNDIVVSGLDTTVNGNASETIAATQSFENLTVLLQAGDDEISLRDVNSPRHLSFFGGDGNDQLELTGVSADHFHLEGQLGNDSFEITDTASRGSTYFYLGDGDDAVAVNTFVSGRNFKVFGDGGNDTFAARDLDVDRKFRLNLGNGDDDAIVLGETEVGKSTKLRLGSGDDFVGLLPEQNDESANFENLFYVDAGDGDDTVAIDDSVQLRRNSRVDGSGGTDTIQRGESGSEIADRIDLNLRSFESNEGANLNALIDDVFTRLQQFGIGEDFFGESSDELGISTSGESLEVTEGDPAVAVDPAIELTGSSQITEATVAVADYQQGQDVFSFVDANGIEGQFDATTGILTLTGQNSTAEYEQALRNVLYENTSENPITDERQVTFRVESGNSSATATRGLQVNSVGDAPVIILQRSSITATADDLPVTLDSLLTVTDADSPNLASAIVAVSDGFVVGQDVLEFEEQDGVIGTFDPSTGALTFSGELTLDAIQTVLRSVTFDSGQDEVGNRTIRFTVNDGALSGFAEITLGITAAN